MVYARRMRSSAGISLKLPSLAWAYASASDSISTALSVWARMSGEASSVY